MDYIDQWDQYDTGSWHRILPARSLHEVVTGECESILISSEKDGFWLNDPYSTGQDQFETLGAAKLAGDEVVERLWVAMPGKLLAEAVLDAEAWTFKDEDGSPTFRPVGRDGVLIYEASGKWAAVRGEEDLGTFATALDAAAALEPGPSPK